MSLSRRSGSRLCSTELLARTSLKKFRRQRFSFIQCVNASDNQGGPVPVFGVSRAGLRHVRSVRPHRAANFKGAAKFCFVLSA